MTKKDYELVASVINDWVGKPLVRDGLFEAFARAFANAYPSFNIHK